MQYTTVRSKEKDYDIYLKSEKLVHSQQEHEKNVSPIWRQQKLVPLFEPDKRCCSYLERKKVDSCYLETKKCSSQLFGARKKISDLVPDICLKSEKCSSQLKRKKMLVPAIWREKKLDSCYFETKKCTNTVAAIWREKKVDPCYLETKKCSSQLLGARKKIMTSI